MGKHRQYVILFMGFFPWNLVAQTMEPFEFTEVMPQFKGGEEAMYKFIIDHLVYPDSARSHGIQGLVIAQFVVDTDSLAKEVRILRGIGYGCDEQVIHVFDLMNKERSWIPGRKNDTAVPVKFTLPITFRLEGKVKKHPKTPK